MGGIGEGKGNITEHAEFNFWVDPDAADAVLNSEVEAKVIAWDTTQLYGYLNEKNFDDLEKINTSLSRFSINIQKRGLEYYKVKYNEHKIDLADPLAMAVMINESETVYKKCKVSIVLNGEKRGRDSYKFIDSGKVQLATKVSRSNFLNILKSSLKK
jgi:purine nucleosidase